MRQAMKHIALAASLVGMAAGCIGSAAAQGEHCSPPSEMKEKLAGKPNSAILNELGVWFAEHNQYACAGDAFATSLQTDPKQADFRQVVFMFGASLYYSGDMKEAAAALAEAERVGYRDAKLYTLQASALDDQKETEKAEAEWKKALEFDPESTVILDALSDDMIARHEYDETVKLLKQRRLGAVRSPQQISNLCTALVKMDKAEQAAPILEDGLNTYPDSQEIAGQLAGVLTQLHRDDEAALVRKLAQAQQQASPETGK
jgi:tetratricopeptide (TPR) repeat protein